REHVEAIIGTPRHLSMHPGGMVVTSCNLSTLVPLEPARMEGRRVCQWDKDMIEDAGLIKVDLLGLGMLAVVRETVDLIADAHGVDIDLAALPSGDPNVYDMLAVSDVIGVFQVESRVQMSTLPRIKPRSIAELAIQIALIRPGPIQGNMVSPYLLRRANREAVRYPHPQLESILKETLGVILFQEQVLQVVCCIAGYSPGQAENLRRNLNKTPSKKAVAEMQSAFVASAMQNGVSRPDATKIFGYVAGFAGYGFCKSHALSFAHLVYQAAWLKCYYPDAFLAALLNNQPLGFYPTDVLINDAKRRSIRILPVDVNQSEARCTVESKGAVRLSLTCVKGLSLAKAQRVEAARRTGEFVSIEDFVRRTELDCATIERLVAAGACDGYNLPRRKLLWQLWILDRWREHNLAIEPELACPDLPELNAWEELNWEYAAQDCSARAHPMQLMRARLKSYVCPSDKLKGLRDGVRVTVAGLVVCLQRPPTAKGFAFLVVEDEDSLINVVITPQIYERFRSIFRLSRFVYVRGFVQRKDGIIHVKAQSFERLDWD
ncbi:MAG: error-prone DNA polymerase, partial [Candidatus Poribacteria bacterium]|nr:error-prone DNA polymerase [Candidatus Poribacteria bacterium]